MSAREGGVRPRGQTPAGDDGTGVVNALAVDLEDYFQVSAFDRIVGFDRWPAMTDRLSVGTDRLLQLFADEGVRATFFVLGWNAEQQPALVRRVADAGHDIASHGYAHQLVYDLSPAAFRADLRRARIAIEDATGVRVVGYRAPSYSVTAASMWALDILAEEGFRWDSSIFPIRHDRYGVPGAERLPYEVRTPGGTLWEVPPTTVRVGGVNLPAAAGGYLRLLPFMWTSWAVRRLNHLERAPVLVSTHPWELDPGQPRLEVDPITRFRHYHNLERTEGRLRHLLRHFTFATVPAALAALRAEATPAIGAAPALAG